MNSNEVTDALWPVKFYTKVFVLFLDKIKFLLIINS